MELEKYIKATKDIIWNAYSEIEAALMEHDEELERQKKVHWQYSKEKADQEYQKAVDKFNTDTQTAVANCRAAIQKQRDGYMKEVCDYYRADGSKIDLNDMNLFKSEIVLTTDEVTDMIHKHIDNPTMLRVIHKFIMEFNAHRSEDRRIIPPHEELHTLRLVELNGRKEEKIFDTFVHLSTMGMNHPDKNYTMFQSRLDGYEEDAVLSLLKAKIYKDDATQQRIKQIEQKQRDEQWKKNKRLNLDPGLGNLFL